jgi:hypothetical protein
MRGVPAQFGVADLVVGAQQPGRAQPAQDHGHNQGDGAARQMAGRYGEQADRQGDYREGRPGESGRVGTVLEGFAGMLTSGTGMVDWGVLAIIQRHSSSRNIVYQTYPHYYRCGRLH